MNFRWISQISEYLANLGSIVVHIGSHIGVFGRCDTQYYRLRKSDYIAIASGIDRHNGRMPVLESLMLVLALSVLPLSSESVVVVGRIDLDAVAVAARNRRQIDLDSVDCHRIDSGSVDRIDWSSAVVLRHQID